MRFGPVRIAEGGHVHNVPAVLAARVAEGELGLVPGGGRHFVVDLVVQKVTRLGQVEAEVLPLQGHAGRVHFGTADLQLFRVAWNNSCKCKFACKTSCKFSS